ncbi:unnamed protein product [Menidia menidia]|uniref:Calcitonin gene-related peptide type 1 receptor n=1 Tax=Menidia menidia TaxID=238744 RepID=A0A8S4ABD6_9TELE|nr:unnamed protein product [Menidia menidia]
MDIRMPLGVELQTSRGWTRMFTASLTCLQGEREMISGGRDLALGDKRTDVVRRLSEVAKSSTGPKMAERKLDNFRWNWIVALVLLCNLTMFQAKASMDHNETQQHPTNVYHDIGVTRNKIVTAQFECYQKIMKDNTHSRLEPMCNRTWDGWLCWDDTKAGVVSEQHCPDYFQDFDPSEMVTKICTDSGHWFLHPESNRTWTNYTQCNERTNEGRMTAMNLFYLALIGHGLSLTSLFVSLAIFFHFKSLSCQRITLHKNLFFSFTSCKVSQFIHLYLFGCNYFWMLCEGIYLHTLIVVAVFAEKQHLMWYYLLGWAVGLAPKRHCSTSSTAPFAPLFWLCRRSRLASKDSTNLRFHCRIVNLFFLLNIVRVLITKLKVTHQAESSLYMKAVRATLILVPLLGIQYVLLPYKPDGRVSSEIYDYIMHILMHYQGLLVATIFCFFNGEVQAVLRRHWNQYNLQFGSSIGNHSDALRSASYTASSITEVQGCYSIDSHSEHMNGKGCPEADVSILKSDNPFA